MGGLRDTVIQYNPYENTGTGWAFNECNVRFLALFLRAVLYFFKATFIPCLQAHSMIAALGHALHTYHFFRDSFRQLQLNGMAQDLSWDNAAVEYENTLLEAKYNW